MDEATREKELYKVFEVSVILKGLNAALEILLGALLFFFKIGDIVHAFIANELLDDPNDFLATHLQPFADKLTPGAEKFAALYLLSHGIVKIVLVAGLLRRKMWAYPASLAVLTLFVIYQVIKWLSTYSIALLLLTVFDLVLIWLIYHEYRRMQNGAKKS